MDGYTQKMQTCETVLCVFVSIYMSSVPVCISSCVWLICKLRACTCTCFVLQAVSHIVIGRLILHGHLDAERQEAEDGTDPEQDREAAEQLTAELDPLRGGGGRSQGVWTIPGQNLHSSGVGQALGESNF